ncbi:hypothetical protein V2G26_019310 [Clonostachys chloroleuca]
MPTSSAGFVMSLSLDSVSCFTALPCFRSTLAHSALSARLSPLAPVFSAPCLHSLLSTPSLYYSLFFPSLSLLLLPLPSHNALTTSPSLQYPYPYSYPASLQCFFRTNRFQGDKPIRGPAPGPRAKDNSLVTPMGWLGIYAKSSDRPPHGNLLHESPRALNTLNIFIYIFNQHVLQP